MKIDDKSDKMLQSMEYIDEKYILEADPSNAEQYKMQIRDDENIVKKQKRKRIYLKAVSIAACVMIVFMALSLWLFLPYNADPPDISEYAGSAYYTVIQKLNALTYPKPKYKNNFDRYILERFRQDIIFSEEFANIEENSASSQHYFETTDNQVSGVIEADTIKRSDKYIYYMDCGILKVFSIDGENSEFVGSYSINSSMEPDDRFYMQYEFFLSSDCRTVTVINPYKDNKNERYTDLIMLDVSDPERITKKKTVTLCGDYMTSRITNDNIFLLTGFSVSEYPDFSDLNSFIPYIDTDDGIYHVSPDNIFISPVIESDSVYYTIAYLLDEETLAMKDCFSFLGYSGYRSDIYFSDSRMYIAAPYTDKKIENDDLISTRMTDIACISYDEDTLEYDGAILLKGYTENQYSMDEYNNQFRIVTTTETYRAEPQIDRISYFESKVSYILVMSATVTNASLYCIDLDTWQISASVEEFAPPNETVRSVRFDKEKAYVCTSVRFTDPVFCFDLSDIQNITVKDTGTIEGFSTSLVDFADGYFLGIGAGDNSKTKVEIYEETDDGIASVCKYEKKGAYSPYYKSYLIDRENSLIGLGMITGEDRTEEDWNIYRYYLLYFDGNELHEVMNAGSRDYNDFKRAAYIDGYIYIFCHDDFKVVKVELPE